MCWSLQAAEYARLCGNDAAREDVYRRYREILLPDQMAVDGSFPRELARTKPYSYSIFNFDVMAGLCQSLKELAPDPLSFHLKDGRGLAKGAEFLYPFLKDKSTWKWARDVEHFDALPVRSPGLLFAEQPSMKTSTLSFGRRSIPIRRTRKSSAFRIRQPLLWV